MKHFFCERRKKKAIINLMASSPSFSQWKSNAEKIRRLNGEAFPPFWNTLLYEKLNGEEYSVFEKAQAKWRLRLSGSKFG